MNSSSYTLVEIQILIHSNQRYFKTFLRVTVLNKGRHPLFSTVIVLLRTLHAFMFDI